MLLILPALRLHPADLTLPSPPPTNTTHQLALSAARVQVLSLAKPCPLHLLIHLLASILDLDLDLDLDLSAFDNLTGLPRNPATACEQRLDIDTA